VDPHSIIWSSFVKVLTIEIAELEWSTYREEEVQEPVDSRGDVIVLS